MVIRQLTFVPVTYILEGLPLPVTRPTHILFGLWVIPGVATLKVLVGYDRPAWGRIRQARMGENANRSFETIIFHVMVNVYMEICGQQLTHVSVTRFPEGLPLPVSKPPQMLGENAKGSFETVIFHMMVNVYMVIGASPDLWWKCERLL